MGIFLLAPLSFAHSLEFPVDEEIETLEVIEITGTVLEKEPRNLHFPIPEIRTAPQVRLTEYLTLPKLKLVKPLTTPLRIILDRTAKTINLHTPVKPLKTERPVYPRRAREQGWQGRVIVRLKILANGTVESGTVHQSSGHQLLDDNAINAASQWTFEPAKNGGFPVATTVNIPIQFDLVQ
jgi:TonB family protein